MDSLRSARDARKSSHGLPTFTQVVESVSHKLSETMRDNRGVLCGLLLAHIFHLSFLLGGAMPWKHPDEWGGADDNAATNATATATAVCHWDSVQVSYIRGCAWGTLPLWIMTLSMPLVLCAMTRDNNLYQLLLATIITLTMITAFTTTVPALLLTVGGCRSEIEYWRPLLCWMAVASHIEGVVISHFL